MGFSTTLARPLQLVTRTMQWSSAVIVMGLTSFFINHGPRGQHTIYQEVIAVLSVVFFLPALISPFLPSSLGRFVLAIDVVFSYLWLTAFIFSAQDYSTRRCYNAIPAGLKCKRKRANEAFIFLVFIFTFCGMFLEVAALWANRRENTTPRTEDDKVNSGTRPPLDAPAAPAGTV
ncbi:MARVEL-like domain [Penicillium digitatum]|uniref:MARVEL-like domain n=1 Tax=Penicillium digitatum TaxID=36651 RepID=A0A7T7BIC1_PENDI|nr:MARVEL-like domain [Penicillium digitatum]